MKKFNNTLTRWRDTLTNDPYMTDDVLEEADEVSLQRVDEAKAVPRPSDIGSLYLEEEYDERADAQPDLFAAEGTRQSAPPQATADSLSKPAADQDYAVELQQGQVTDTAQSLQTARKVLRPLTRRGPKEKRMKSLRTFGILLGDITGVTGAAIMLGEIPLLAIIQAIAVGTAGITSGLLAAEIKDARQARKRQKDDAAIANLSDDDKVFAHLFRGPDEGEFIAKLMVYGGLFLVLLIFGGIMALRSTTEGLIAGIVFGCLAAAVALASWANNYFYADEVADLLDNYETDYRSNISLYEKLSLGKTRIDQAHAATTAQSIKDEFTRRGEAARHQMQAAKARALRGNPGVAGHGRPVQTPTSNKTTHSKIERKVQDAPDSPDSPNHNDDIVVLGSSKSNGHGNGQTPEVP